MGKLYIVGYRECKRYSLLIGDAIGTPCYDVQRCANSIKECLEVYKKYREKVPFCSAVVYCYNRRGNTYTYGTIDFAGRFTRKDK